MIQNSTLFPGSWSLGIFLFEMQKFWQKENTKYNCRNAVLIMKKFCRDNPSERLGYQKVGQITFQITCHHLSPNLKPTSNIFSLVPQRSKSRWHQSNKTKTSPRNLETPKVISNICGKDTISRETAVQRH